MEVVHDIPPEQTMESRARYCKRKPSLPQATCGTTWKAAVLDLCGSWWKAHCDTVGPKRSPQ